MKRLIKKESITSPITPRTEKDVPGFIPGPPPYATGVDSYTQYLMQNPNNKYIKRLRGEEPAQKDVKYMSDVIDEYMEDDKFTIKKTK